MSESPADAPKPATAAEIETSAPPLVPAHHHLLTSLQSMLNLTVVALFFITFSFQPFRIPSASMEPTLLVGDFLLVDKQITHDPPLLPPSSLHRGDVIVFHDPIDHTQHLVKRIIGVPGDRLRLRSGRVVLNGQTLDEPYAVYRGASHNQYRDNFPNAQTPDSDVDANWWIRLRTLVNHGDLVVPPDSFFVLGDNRNDSLDSRFWGFVPRSAVVGRPFLIYLSLRIRDNDPSSEASPTFAPVQPRTTPGLLNFARWNRTLTVVH
ncbi:signal peptidase I Serine peptidase. MEROPS family S26A [Granulicella pectinivorans]|jgi:signal peptidase I|uniref:Signal peptidase I n=1 Tax=Granulicella pectinivorans TaxID=474950 RepID=A0A1I6LX89_9BACT|nr:signal peptidase I [Granulicella pectinivorans]SFS08018.1 signal peptidase I Serine peptidase. MEROPS family S26A [Granulicella pectinivorans]